MDPDSNIPTRPRKITLSRSEQRFLSIATNNTERHNSKCSNLNDLLQDNGFSACSINEPDKKDHNINGKQDKNKSHKSCKNKKGKNKTCKKFFHSVYCCKNKDPLSSLSGSSFSSSDVYEKEVLKTRQLILNWIVLCIILSIVVILSGDIFMQIKLKDLETVRKQSLKISQHPRFYTLDKINDLLTVSDVKIKIEQRLFQEQSKSSQTFAENLEPTEFLANLKNLISKIDTLGFYSNFYDTAKKVPYMASKTIKTKTKSPSSNNRRGGRITFGKSISSKEALWHSAIYRLKFKTQTKERTISHPSCGGFILSRVFIGTAAHCLIKVKPEELFTVTKIAKPKDGVDLFVKNGNSSNVGKILVHPYFFAPYMRHDIGLIKLKSEDYLTGSITPVLLPSILLETLVHQTEFFKNCQITGFGLMQRMKLPDKLQRAHITMTPIEKCEKFLTSDRLWDSIQPRNFIKLLPRHLLSLGLNSVQDACLGDSGGPLVCEYGVDLSKNSSQFLSSSNHFSAVKQDLKATQKVLIGVISYGFGNSCGEGKPAMYTNVVMYSKWLIETMIKNLI